MAERMGNIEVRGTSGKDAPQSKRLAMASAGRVVRMEDDEPTLRSRRVPGAKRIRQRDLPVFTRSLAAMLSAGIPINECLRALRAQAASPQLRTILDSAGVIVQDGNPLSAAFSVYPGVFDSVYTGMLRSAEASGRMAEVLENLADQMEESAELRHRVQSAMLYPIAVAVLAALVTTGILVWIVPTFERIYADMGQTLPLATRIMIGLSRLIREQAGLVVLFLLAMAGVLWMFGKTREGRRAIHRAIMIVPIVGPLMQKLAIVRFADPLAQMLRNGVPILNALGLAAPVANNCVFEDLLTEAIGDLTEGQVLSASLKKHRCIPPMMVEMVVAGEKTGRLDEFLERTAQFYRKEVSVSVRGLTTLIEPLLIVFLGGVIGGIVVCLFVPIFRLHELVQ